MADQSKRILKLHAVREVTSLGRSSIYEKERRGEFPQRVALGPRSVGWYADEVAAWIESRTRKVSSGGQP